MQHVVKYQYNPTNPLPAKDPSLFDELKNLLRDRVVRATDDGENDPEAPTTRKRARREEFCVQGTRLQFTYRYRKTVPRYSRGRYKWLVPLPGRTPLCLLGNCPIHRFTVLTYASDECGSDYATADGPRVVPADAVGGGRAEGSQVRPKFSHLRLSQSTLLVWVYRFDPENPYSQVIPNDAGLQFQTPRPPARPGRGGQGGERVMGATGDMDRADQHREAAQKAEVKGRGGLLAWLWGTGSGGGGGGEGEGEGAGEGFGGGGGGYNSGSRSHHRVSQRFINEALIDLSEPGGGGFGSSGGSLQDQEEEDMRLAIQMSLEEAERGGSHDGGGVGASSGASQDRRGGGSGGGP